MDGAEVDVCPPFLNQSRELFESGLECLCIDVCFLGELDDRVKVREMIQISDRRKQLDGCTLRCWLSDVRIVEFDQELSAGFVDRLSQRAKPLPSTRKSWPLKTFPSVIMDRSLWARKSAMQLKQTQQ
jgi:hypothetical protein